MSGMLRALVGGVSGDKKRSKKFCRGDVRDLVTSRWIPGYHRANYLHEKVGFCQ